jgi:acetylxylan esterase
MRFLPSLAGTFALASLANALTSSLQQVTSFTTGPTNAGMYVYIPTTKVASAPIIVAIHWCGGTANDYFSDTLYATYADTYGYIVIYPDSPSSDNCWDVASLASLTHNGGGDSLTIVNMVKYAVANYGGDLSRVYATGLSSGAMMTNVLAGAYPDIFKAGTVYSGVPDGCFYVSSAAAGMAQAAWNTTCSTGMYVQTAQQWGNLVRSYYPGYTGSYPKMAMYVLPSLHYPYSCISRLNRYHGTADFTLAYPSLAEEMKEWSNVLGVSWSQNTSNTPIAGYTKMVYGDGTKLVGFSALDVGHSVPVRAEDDLAWFGLWGSSVTSISSTKSSTTSTKPSTLVTSTMTTKSTTSSMTSSASATTSASSGGAAHWGQW